MTTTFVAVKVPYDVDLDGFRFCVEKAVTLGGATFDGWAIEIAAAAKI